MTVTKEQATDASNTEFHSSLYHNSAGTCERWRRNGNTKTWKTRPDEFRLPIKWGLYGFGYITELNSDEFHLASECTLTIASHRGQRSKVTTS